MKKGKTQRDSKAPIEDSRFVAIDTEPAGLNERRDSLMSAYVGRCRVRREEG